MKHHTSTHFQLAALAITLILAPALNAQTALNFAGSTYTNSDGGVNTVHRWANVGDLNGNSFDLIATHTPLDNTTYQGGGGGKQGSGTGYGHIGMPQDTAGFFEFSFVDAGNNAVTIANLDFSILDIDHYTGNQDLDPNNLGRESIRWNSDSVLGEGDSTMQLVYTGGGVQDAGGNDRYEYRFKSFDNLISQIDNPTDPNALTQQQLDHSLKIRFTNVSSFELRLGNSEPDAGDGGGRKFFFSGTSALVPEPSSAMLAGLGFIFVLFRRYRV
ncbi:PEP-CTERM sorting domain-containing protein [Akkermansiaceae bacterium]|nr:PEP-CTERM sorting domain-containing protein [Akkermansiaceae bacterium]